MHGLSRSTAPSFASRITAVGKAYDHFERRQGRDASYVFSFVNEGGGPISIETEIILPDWNSFPLMPIGHKIFVIASGLNGDNCQGTRECQISSKSTAPLLLWP